MAASARPAPVPHIALSHVPTPLEPLPRLSAALGGPTLWVKRDDATGLAVGGNKVRKLEYLMADAAVQGADMVVTVGATEQPLSPDGGGRCQGGYALRTLARTPLP